MKDTMQFEYIRDVLNHDIKTKFQKYIKENFSEAYLAIVSWSATDNKYTRDRFYNFKVLLVHSGHPIFVEQIYVELRNNIFEFAMGERMYPYEEDISELKKGEWRENYNALEDLCPNEDTKSYYPSNKKYYQDFH